MKLNEAMNNYVANQMVMYIKLHNLHWYLQGSSFFTLHAKFEELYDQTADIMDDVAERMLAMGQAPVASMQKALSMASVKELTDAPINTQGALKEIMTDVEYWIKDTKEIIALCEQENDVVSADLFTGYLKEYEKLSWMLKAYSK